jgi:hypothetical protein
LLQESFVFTLRIATRQSEDYSTPFTPYRRRTSEL